jgi:hypothetical protein
MISRVLSSFVVASALAVGFGSMAAQATSLEGLQCNIGNAELVKIMVGDPNPRAGQEGEWRDTVDSWQHAVDLCIHHFGGRPQGPVRD